LTREFPAIADLIPHADAMLLLDSVVEHAPEFTICSVDLRASALFADADGGVPSWLGLEYIAQCAAVHGGLVRPAGHPPRPGLLLGSRRLHLHTDRFEPDQPDLEVMARHHRGESGLVAFDGSVKNPQGDVLAEGRINLYILEDWSELAEAKR
jgi:predicted hotdog family 3-hydroxylacyl-ACP dehydratase